MTKPKVAPTQTEALQNHLELAASKAKNRNQGGTAWNVTRNVLGILSLALGVIGGSAVWAGKSTAETATTLGILVLAGGLCGSIGTFLKAEARFLANKDEAGQWQALVNEIHAANAAILDANPAPGPGDAQKLVDDLTLKIDKQLQSDSARRHNN